MTALPMTDDTERWKDLVDGRLATLEKKLDQVLFGQIAAAGSGLLMLVGALVAFVLGHH